MATHRHRFQLLGGHPALDFVNTVQDWTVEPPADYLGDFADAIRFGETAGFLTRADARGLRSPNPQVELRRLKELRGLLKRVFEMWLKNEPRPEDLETLNAHFADAIRSTRLKVEARTRSSQPVRVRKEIAPESAGDALLRLRVVEAAVELLVSDRMLRLKTCPSCGWFFLDASKNSSRRWCSMAMCGSVAKARRYYRRKKATAAARSNR